MSVGHRLDIPAVQRLRGQPLRYLGMMGSRRRVATCVATLSAAGFTSEDVSPGAYWVESRRLIPL
jgi:xanthine/CO dehydrogenase XdhC/CoxF family maturation factor